jgi:hypothetical protein
MSMIVISWTTLAEEVLRYLYNAKFTSMAIVKRERQK